MRYVDPDGRAPKNITEKQRSVYMNKVKTFTPEDIPNDYDCADTALFIYNKSYETSTSVKDNFKNIIKNGSNLDYLRNIQAADLFGSKNINNKIIYYYSSNDSGRTYDSKLADRKFNSKNIEIGTVGVYSPAPGATGFTGHVITVIGVERDKNGNVVSIDYIEGHMEGQEQTVYTFTKEGGVGNSSLHGKYSDCIFIGWGEFEF